MCPIAAYNVADLINCFFLPSCPIFTLEVAEFDRGFFSFVKLSFSKLQTRTVLLRPIHIVFVASIKADSINCGLLHQNSSLANILLSSLINS